MNFKTYPKSFHDGEAVDTMRREFASMKGAIGGVDSRALFDEMMSRIPSDGTTQFSRSTVGGVSGWWCTPKTKALQSVILYLHGGGYVVGSATAYRNFVSHFASRIGCEIFLLDYRLAPENPFPAAYLDVLQAYDGLAMREDRGIALMGDSAGGGLALAVLKELVGRKSRPLAVSTISPWTDLTLSGDSIESLSSVDPLSSRITLERAADLYVVENDKTNPLASPLYGDVTSTPPIQIVVGSADILLDDSRRYASSVFNKGGEIECHIWEGMPHVFPANIGTLDAAMEALSVITNFLKMKMVKG